MGDCEAQNLKKKNIFGKNKNLKLWIWSLTHNVSTLTGIFGLKHISATHYKHFTIKSLLFIDLGAEFEDILYKLNFKIFSENYHKIVWTAITHWSHHVKATDFKTGQMLTEKLWKQNKN